MGLPSMRVRDGGADEAEGEEQDSSRPGREEFRAEVRERVGWLRQLTEHMGLTVCNPPCQSSEEMGRRGTTKK